MDLHLRPPIVEFTPMLLCWGLTKWVRLKKGRLGGEKADAVSSVFLFLRKSMMLLSLYSKETAVTEDVRFLTRKNVGKHCYLKL